MSAVLAPTFIWAPAATITIVTAAAGVKLIA